MENSKTLIKQEEEEDDEELEGEEFREEFKCCVCLDLLYKPVVLGCGQILCFWCVFNSMNTFRESNCLVCQHPYNHFPSICHLLHFLLQKLYPAAYKRREKQVGEEEKGFGCFSPQIENSLSGSNPTESVVGNVPYSPACLQSKNSGSCSFALGESPSHVDSPETTSDYEANITKPTTSPKNVEATRYAVIQDNCFHGNDVANGTHKKVSFSDLLCVACKNLLFQPVVLNCGHVYCESCICIPVDGISRCQICQSMHPNGFPSVCLVLKHFLEEQYPEIYAQRRTSSVNQTDCQSRAHQHAGPSLSTLSDNYLSCSSGRQNVHFGIGCDYCGMFPIIGERYKCKDCVEEMGFDLCEACYNAPFKICGRFNQQHKPEHKLELVPPVIMDMLSYQSDEDGPEFQEDLGNVSPAAPVPQDPENGSNNPENGSNNVQNVSPAFVMSVDASLDPDDYTDDCGLSDLTLE